MLRKPGQLAGAFIVGFWLIMAGMLLYREVWLPRVNRLPVTQSSLPQDVWMGVYVGEQKVGFLHTQSSPTMVEGQEASQLRFLGQIRLSLFGRESELYANGEAVLSRAAGSDFNFNVRSGAQEMRVEGTLGEGKLEVKLHTAGEEIPFSFPVDDQLVFSLGTGMPALSVVHLEPGEEVYVDAFDPVRMQVAQAKLVRVGDEALQVGEETVQAAIIETTLGGFKTRAWVNEQGEMIQAETPLGLKLRRITADEAIATVSSSAGADLVEHVAVRPQGLTPAAGAKQAKYRIHNLDAELLPPVEEYQTRAGEILEVMSPSPPFSGGAELDEAALEEALASDPLVNSHHERIVSTAQEIIGESGTAWEKAVAIYRWVYLQLEKTPIITVPSSLDVLRTREGDCNEHTVLFTALARSVGVPTRIAVGLVWSDELGGFGYHAWPEVYAGQWVPMDPTLGQPVADATHIKLLNGGIEKWVQLLPYIGKLQIEVLEMAPGTGEARSAP